ncbi:S41 family peptidase [Acidianus sp. RZ1]|uniref:S41 family peptidase n=1 Tax=Acidianus sp. RZ1 TaxID=1540082 RepID=UPI001490CE90|nr:S41 family peptidase [Acidianus sp. RZ1]NON61292.1 peptidase [Acidianus sp. RZ1]
MKTYKIFPAIHNDKIAFTTDDDIWISQINDPKYERLTSGLGVAIRPRFSPDGKNIAFTLIQLKDGKGISEVYVMPSSGGEPKRVTFFGRPTTFAAGWRDNNTVLVITDYQTPFSYWTELYEVNVNTNSFKRLPFGNVSSVFWKDNVIIIGRGYQDLPFWKGYKGGRKGELWISKDGGKTFSRFVSLEGNVAWPMIVGERVFFISEHEGIGNLYSVDLEGKDLRKHSDFTNFGARNANSDGKRIVMQSGGEIYLFDGETKQLEIDVQTDRRKAQQKFVDIKIDDFSTNGDMISVSVRGRPFLLRPWSGPAVQLGERQGVRYKLVRVLHDGGIIAVSDERGYDRLVRLDPNRSTIIDKDFGRIEQISISPDGKKVLISNNKLELWLLDLGSLTEKLIDSSEYGIISQISWHPNNSWFAYSFPESPGTSSIRICSINGKPVKVTSGYSIDFSPAFDPEGKYLYFLSSRNLDPMQDPIFLNMSFPKAVKPYIVPLSNCYSPFNQPIENIECKQEVEVDGIQERVTPFPLDGDNYVAIAGAKGRVFMAIAPIQGMLKSREEVKERIDFFDFNTMSKDVFLDNVNAFVLSFDGTKILVKQGGSIRFLEVSSKPEQNVPPNPDRKTGVIDLSRVKLITDPRMEWEQMFNETWRLMEENYWRKDFDSINWYKIKEKYKELIHKVGTRYELSDLLKEMIGETRTSHSYEIPTDFDTPIPYPVGSLGASLEFNGECYTITKIFEGDPANDGEKSPLKEAGVNLEEGDCIIAIDGVKLGENVNPQSLLVNKSGTQVILSVITKSGQKREVTVRTLNDEERIVYRDWVEKNRKYVHQKTQGQVGYIHIPNMGPEGFAEFYRSFISEFYKSGLIIDVRYNGGGYISGVLLQRLLMRSVGFIVPRNGKSIPFPEYSVPKVTVAITNENAGSDGDLFSFMFKQFKLGTLIGKRTWGGVVGISGRHKLIDGTMVSQPEFAVHMYDIGLGIENHGVEPDVDVDITPQDYALDKDPQLDKAIEIALANLEKK